MADEANSVTRGLTGIMMYRAYQLTTDMLNAQMVDHNGDVQNSIMAQMLLGVTLESAANEVGAEVMSRDEWTTVERMDPKTKWWVISGMSGKKRFEFGREPLQTIGIVMAIRNKLVHPKSSDFTHEVVILTPDGKLHRHVGPEENLRGDPIHHVTAQLYEDCKFNANRTLELLKKTVNALALLRAQTDSIYLRWTEKLVDDLKYLQPHE